MKLSDLQEELQQVATRLGVTVRYERANFTGGSCTLHGEALIIVNSKLTLREKVRALAKEVSRLPLDDVFIRPEVRRHLEGFGPLPLGADEAGVDEGTPGEPKGVGAG
ncbi:MAG: hypothetical protein PVF51_08235 [Nitrospirota bacterium]|jgi:hypothetical protein